MTTTKKFNARTYRKEITALVSEMKKADLKAYAKENGIKLIRGAGKPELIKHVIDEAVKLAKAAAKSGKSADTKTTKKPRKTEKVSGSKKTAKTDSVDLSDCRTKKDVKTALKGLDKAELLATAKSVKAAKVADLKEMSPKEIRNAIAEKVVAKNKKAADKAAKAEKPAKSPKKAGDKKADKKTTKSGKADKKNKKAKADKNEALVAEINKMVEVITNEIGNENRAVEVLENAFAKLFKCHTVSIEEDGIYYTVSDDRDMWLNANTEKLEKFVEHCVKTDVVDNAIGNKTAAKKTTKLTDEAKAMIKLVNRYNKAKEAGKTKTAKKLIAEINEMAGA